MRHGSVILMEQLNTAVIAYRLHVLSNSGYMYYRSTMSQLSAHSCTLCRPVCFLLTNTLAVLVASCMLDAALSRFGDGWCRFRLVRGVLPQCSAGKHCVFVVVCQRTQLSSWVCSETASHTDRMCSARSRGRLSWAACCGKRSLIPCA